MRRHGKVAMIAAVGPDLELGSGGDLVWHISADLKRFKQLTMGHPVIMGRKTWESLPKRPLPGRKNVVLSRTVKDFPGAVCVDSPEQAIAQCADAEMMFVIGGAGIYGLFMPYADTLYLTHVNARPEKSVDCWMPDYREYWQCVEASGWETDPKGVRYRFERWVRK